MIYRVSITGTESTGKTTLAGQLATHYNTVVAVDQSRNYIEKLDRKYNHTDVLEIAKKIILEEDRMLHYSHRVLFSDNDLTNIKIWLHHRKWAVPDWLEKDIQKRKYDLYLLCGIDVAWQEDAQREHPDYREELFKHFQTEFNSINANYKLVKGLGEKRLQSAIEIVDEFMANPFS
jgi:nicotinamide riboside kinase